MTPETLLQDVNIVLDWHDGGFLDCYQEADNENVRKVLMRRTGPNAVLLRRA